MLKKIFITCLLQSFLFIYVINCNKSEDYESGDQSSEEEEEDDQESIVYVATEGPKVEIIPEPSTTTANYDQSVYEEIVTVKNLTEVINIGNDKERLVNTIVDDESNEYLTVNDIELTEDYKITAYSTTESPTSAETDQQNGKASYNDATLKYDTSQVPENPDAGKKSTSMYPFAVSIQRKGAHYATGALLNERWILSAAGEFYNMQESLKLFKARLGSVDCKKGGILVPIKRIEIHPYYVFGQSNFDLAMLRIAQPIEYSDFIKPISLSKISNVNVLSASFLTIYWPRLIVRGQVLLPTAKERIKPSSMRVSAQSLIPWEKCEKLMAFRDATLDKSTLCLKPLSNHHSICMPDAGAPVIADDGLWGVTSGWTSKNCLTNLSPAVFSRISSPLVRAWLYSQMLSS